MERIGFIFPGQGAQTVGMGKDLYSGIPEARGVYDEASDVVGFSVSKLCFEGPEETLQQTVRTQIAIFVTSLACLRAVQSRFPNLVPQLACGLSVGEFAALFSLRSIAFRDCLNVVKRRGELMEEASQMKKGAMASVLGLSREECTALCQDTQVEAANFNSPEQTVISGAADQIEHAVDVFREKGARRVLLLKVGGAFHSSLMQSAGRGFEAVIKQTKINKPEGIYVSNVTGGVVSDPEKIRSLLTAQLTSPVEWVRSMNTVVQLGITKLIEIGPGKVLKGLARKIDPRMVVTNVGSTAELESLAPAFASS